MSKQKSFKASKFEEHNPLGETSIDDFLSHYWQKKPLLIRNAFVDVPSPVTADELAGLACEEYVNARLVFEKTNNKNWQVEFGPFQEERFNDLPECNWSLLVSDVEKHVPRCKSLLKAFRFIPDWRIDDLMISYAPTGGSVGAHTDAYDVFLIQLSGQRLWKISENYSPETLTDTDLCILKKFSAEKEWLLNAGDMLYLPANVAHHGIAQNYKNKAGEEEHCLTASVGFRAPSVKTMVSDYTHFLTENKQMNKRYRDEEPAFPVHHAEISEDTVSQFIKYLTQGFSLEREQVKQWLGQHCSDNKAFEDIAFEKQQTHYDKLPEISSSSKLSQSPYSQFLFSHSHKNTFLFVDGISYKVSTLFAELICKEENIDFIQLNKNITEDEKTILLTLLNNGSIIL